MLVRYLVTNFIMVLKEILYCIDKLSGDDEEYEDFSAQLTARMRQKIESQHGEFRRRFPRAEYRSSSAARRITYNLPRPLKLADPTKQPQTTSEKVSEILFSLDTDDDGAADPWELHEWIVWVQNLVYVHALRDQWYGMFVGNSTGRRLSWPEYQSAVNPDGRRTESRRRRAERDRRRWRRADADGDDALTKHEFKLFLFPQLSENDAGAPVLVPEAHEDLDTDFDGRVSLKEFLDVHRDDEENGVGR